jgi:membrane associated rhomboid family serine protease
VVLEQSAGDGRWRQVASDDPRDRDPSAARSLTIDACPVCFGAWFDAGELDVLAEASNQGEVEAEIDHDAIPSRRVCPHGHGVLLEHRVPGKLRTPIDRCPTCAGVWLDGNERRKLAAVSTQDGQRNTQEEWLRRGAIWAAQLVTHLPVEVENPTRSTPWVVYALLASLLAVFLAQLGGAIDTYAYGLVAGRLKLEGDIDTLFTSIFMHGDWVHLLSNAYFLYVFGDNVEHLFGRVRFALYFVLAGLAGGLVHVALTRATALPVVGASGAISGVLAAYVWSFPRQQLLQVVFYIQMKIPVLAYLALWVGLHVVMGFFSTDRQTAWFAHLGGFMFGLIATPLLHLWIQREVAARTRVPWLRSPRSPHFVLSR